MGYQIPFGVLLALVGLVIFYPSIREYLRYRSQSNLWTAQMLETGDWSVEEVIEIWGGVRLVLFKDGHSDDIDHERRCLDIDSYHPDFCLVSSAQVGDIMIFKFQKDPIVGVKKQVSAYLRLTKIPVGIVAPIT